MQIICRCRSVTRHQIEDAVRDGACLYSLVQLRLGVGTGIQKDGRPACGSCAPAVVDVIERCHQTTNPLVPI